MTSLEGDLVCHDIDTLYVKMELFSLSDNEGWLYVIVEPNVGLMALNWIIRSVMKQIRE